MIRSILIGALAGMRAMTPLAAVANAASRGELGADNGAPKLIGSNWIAAGTLALAAGELAGDKMKSAPDRTVAAGMAARSINAGVTGAALSPRRNRAVAMAAAVAAAVGTSYLTLHFRKQAMRRFGQTATGIVEDALTVAGSLLIVRNARR